MINNIYVFSKKLKVGKKASYSIFQKYHLTGCATKLPRLGLSRLPITVQLNDSAIKVAYVTGIDLTGRETICAAEFTGRQAQCKNFMNGKNRQAGLGFALKHANKPVSYENKVFWTEKTMSTSFYLLGNAQS